MTRLFVRTTILAILLAILAAVSVAAEVIKAGVDYWRTPASGTAFKFPDGDVEALCKKKPDPAWNHEVSLKGIPAKGSDWDSAVARLVPAVFKNREALTKVQFKSLALESTAPSSTPCGRLNWKAQLSKRGVQPITKMKITRKSDKGGTFSADLALKVELRATDADTGKYVGSLFYDVKLPNPTGDTVWSYGANHAFRPGMDETDHCIQVLRDKLGTFPPGSRHIYFISNLIAQGKCREQG